ncbi:MAG: amidohydrolase [Gammaproteobacteria bacterium]|nr:amidohydrolase [Gammaproteobacteria bacterium]
MRKIDLFNHIWPPAYYARLQQLMPRRLDITMRSEQVPMMTDLDERLRVMDRFDDYQQVLSLAAPSIEMIPEPRDAADLARVGNDDLRALCDRYPERFPGFIAALAMNNAEAMVAEARRAVRDLGALGVQIYSNVNGKPLDAPQFRPLFELMAELDRPIWIHPARNANFPDYLTEDRSLYEIWWTFGWPYETSVALARLVFSKVMDAVPNLKIIAHHAGGMIPFFEGRVGPGWDQLGSRTSNGEYRTLLSELKLRPIDYFRKFYADTATFGSSAALTCALSFFGAEHVVFASDAPFDPERGPMYIRETIRVIDELDISDEDRRRIYHGNAQRLTGLR